ncbi:MAG: hypothetical protein HRT38_04495 [Alteromonadaceae bacterium]|nr:hypothetical protein [Alteromonadaceae bacterium]
MVEGILKGCDIILALSENTINFQFEQLYHRNVIPNKWNAKDESTESEFEAKIESPTISIIEDDRKKINLEIYFTSGTLSYWKGFGPSATRMTEDMKGWKYIFEVNIGLISHPADQFVSGNTHSLTVTQEATKQVKDSIDGISDKYFTIESLFMDFTNTNFTRYDTSKSVIIVDEPSALDTFQILISNYFKRLAETQNPYILGHSIKRIDHESQPASFQPTNCRYSTSYNKKSELSALNFLMMIDRREFPEAQDCGILSRSLITNEDASVDGVFFLNYNDFKVKYIDITIIPIIQNTFNEYVANFSKQEFRAERSWISDEEISVKGFSPIEFKAANDYLWDANLQGSLFIETTSRSGLYIIKMAEYEEKYNYDISLSVESKHNNYLDIVLSMTIHVDVTLKKPDGLLGHKTISGYLSNKPDNKGRISKLHIEFRCGQKGKIDIVINKEKEVFIENNMEEIKEQFPDVSRTLQESLLSTHSRMEECFYKILPQLQSEFTTIAAQKTVLPLGNVYTYKNIRLFDSDKKSKSPIDNAICFDIAYMPVSNK